MKDAVVKLLSEPKPIRDLAILLFLVGAHSVCLGIFIFFFTEFFYQFFFRTRIDNIFFIRQAGLFLFCLGLFYFVPLFDFHRRYQLLTMVIATKALAVLFLVTNAHLAPWPPILLLAAAIDGCMALMLALSYRQTLQMLKQAEVPADSN